MAVTDIIICAILLILANNGFCKGFLRSLVGPTCFLLSIATSYMILFTWHSLPSALLFSLFGPFLLTWGANGLIEIWFGEIRQDPVPFSRFMGSVVNIVWGGTALALGLFLISLIPLNGTDLSFIREDVNKSVSYHLLTKAFSKHIPMSAKVSNCVGDVCTMSEENKQALANDEDVKELMNDPRLQRIANDTTLREAARKKDLSALMTNPAIMELTSDPEFVIKVLKLYPKIQSYTHPEQTNANSQ